MSEPNNDGPMSDDEAAAFYRASASLPTGERVTPKKIRLSGHVPVRFSESTIGEVKRLAALDGVSVSTWIRQLVDKAVRARTSPVVVSVGEELHRATFGFGGFHEARARTETARLVRQ